MRTPAGAAAACICPSHPQVTQKHSPVASSSAASSGATVRRPFDLRSLYTSLHGGMNGVLSAAALQTKLRTAGRVLLVRGTPVTPHARPRVARACCMIMLIKLNIQCQAGISKISWWCEGGNEGKPGAEADPVDEDSDEKRERGNEAGSCLARLFCPTSLD